MVGTSSRRKFMFLAGIASAGFWSVAHAAGLRAIQQQGQSQDNQDISKPSKNRSAPLNTPPSDAPSPDPKAILKANDKDLKAQVIRLAELVEDLKNEVEKIDSTAVLSLSMLHKTEEIEKLAKHISTLARA